MTTLIVPVTQEHIDRGLPKSGTSCPIALALWDLGFTDAQVLDTRWEPNMYGFESFPLYPRARRFVETFDNGGEVQPTTLRLRYEE